MSDLPTIPLVDSVTSADLCKLSVELGDVALDALMATSNIPVLGSLIALIKTGRSVRDRLFLRKVISFLAALGAADVACRQKLKEYLTSNDDKKRFGENILLLIERADDMRKPELIGHIWAACAMGEISYKIAMRESYMIDRVYWSDLKHLRVFKDGLQGDNTPIAESLHAAGFVSQQGVDGGNAWGGGGFKYGLNEYGKIVIQFGLNKMR